MCSFPHFEPSLDILFEKLTLQVRVVFEKCPLHTIPRVLWILYKACFLF